MKLSTAAFLLLLLPFVTGCSSIVLLLMGTESTPKQVERSEIANDLHKKYSIDKTDVLFTDSTLLDSFTRTPFKPGWDTGFRPLQFRLYDINSDSIITHYSSCESSSMIFSLKPLLDTFPARNILPPDSSLLLSDEVAAYERVNPGITAHYCALKGAYDYCFWVYHGTYMGRFGRIMLEDILEYVREDYPDKKIKVIVVNTNPLDE